ncbi:MAG: AbrB/MazE/SpoVT family DNA-binding domain-containing protein [Planctomycetota bacterium]
MVPHLRGAAQGRREKTARVGELACRNQAHLQEAVEIRFSPSGGGPVSAPPRQVTLPAELRRRLKLAVGDLLEATVRAGAITLAPRSPVRRELPLGLKDIEQGRSIGPVTTAKKAVTAPHRRARWRTRR